MLVWLSVAPFGEPVVPLVYWMLMGSPGDSCASRAASASGATCAPPSAKPSQAGSPIHTTCSSAGVCGATAATISS
jgi:hypothetical protein